MKQEPTENESCKCLTSGEARDCKHCGDSICDHTQELHEEHECEVLREQNCDHDDIDQDEFVCLNCGSDRREAIMSNAYDSYKASKYEN